MRTIAFTFVLLTATWLMAGQNIVVVFDDSGSMEEGLGNTSKIEAAKASMKTVLSKCTPDTKVGILAINNGWIVPIGPITSNTLSAVNSLRPNGGTPLGNTIKQAADALLELRQKEKYGTYRLLVISDGQAEDETLMIANASDIVRRGIIIDVVGVKMRSNHALAAKAKTYRRADDPASLQKALSEGFAEKQVKPGSNVDEDFELLKPLPSDLARQALAALAEVNNSPIQAVSVNQNVTPAQAPVPAPTAAASGMSAVVVVFIVLGGLVAVIIVIAFIRCAAGY